MSAEKRLQRILNRANKGTGNTTEATDNRDEIQEALTASGKGNLVRRGKRLYEKMNKGSGILMTSPLNKDRTGDRVSWKYGDGTYSGTCINASCSRARTENGKVKYLPKNKKK